MRMAELDPQIVSSHLQHEILCFQTSCDTNMFKTDLIWKSVSIKHIPSSNNISTDKNQENKTMQNQIIK